ncbi:MAG: radical SAM protein [Methanoregulaceae archaeon]|jgi:putative pyruvate formate lyase activating enzyme|nr:radical SAM protein [Methanoregulaceae archaeon]
MNAPSYQALLVSGELSERVMRARALLSSCTVCPRHCGVDRTNGERGYCGGGFLPEVSGYGPHFGEEPPLVGSHGSGTIFFSGCTMRCIFCQNYEISQLRHGTEVSCERLAGMMLELQDRRCHNINLVSPGHFVPQILETVFIAAGEGLHIPLVYNTGTYDSIETLRLLDGVVDIYMPDAKYGREEIARALSDAPGYPAIMQEAIIEMQRQAGDLVVRDGVAERGLNIRHLVLPGDLADSDLVMKFIGERVSKDAYVNIMDQYHWNRSLPHQEFLTQFSGFEPLLRGITDKEYRYAVECAKKYGLHRGFS